MTIIYVTNNDEEEEANSLLSKVPESEKRYTVKRGPVTKLAKVINGRETEWFLGFQAVRSLLVDGYVAQAKFCTYLQKKCIKTE